MKNKIKLIKLFLLSIVLSTGANAKEFNFRSYIYGMEGIGSITEADKNEMGGLPSDIVCGNYHCLALIDGTVWGIGSNGYGQLGDSEVDISTGGKWKKGSLTGVTSIHAGGEYSYAVINNEIWATGKNYYGVLGIEGQTGDVATWTNTKFSGFTYLHAGYATAFAVKDGVLWAVGNNSHRQTGIQGYTSIRKWMSTGVTGVTQAVSGADHAHIVKDGNLWSAGSKNIFGEAGGVYETGWTLKFSGGADGITKMAATHNGLFVLVDGNVYFKGRHGLGLGHGNNVKSFVYTGLSGVTDIIGGTAFGVAIKNNEIWSTGFGQYSTLGTGNKNSQYSWVNVGAQGISKVYGYQDYMYGVVNNEMWHISPTSLLWEKAPDNLFLDNQ